jgi:hypothetical protein
MLRRSDYCLFITSATILLSLVDEYIISEYQITILNCLNYRSLLSTNMYKNCNKVFKDTRLSLLLLLYAYMCFLV